MKVKYNKKITKKGVMNIIHRRVARCFPYYTHINKVTILYFGFNQFIIFYIYKIIPCISWTVLLVDI